MRGKLRFEGEPLSPNILTENTRKTKQKQKTKAKSKPSYMDSVEYSPEYSTTARQDGNPSVTANPSELSGDSGHSLFNAEQLHGIPIKKSKLRFDKTESNSIHGDSTADANGSQANGLSSDGKPPTGSKLQFDKTENAGMDSDNSKPGNQADSSDSKNEADTVTADQSNSSSSDNQTVDSNKSRKITKLEEKTNRYNKKLEKTRAKLPTKQTQQKQRVFDDTKGKASTKIQFEPEIIPIGEANWNKNKKRSIPRRVIGKAGSITATKIHAKIHQAESQNVGVEATHKAELMGESAVRGAKRGTRSAYRYYKNRHYRRASKLEVKSIKTRIKLDYEKAVQEHPGIASGRRLKFGSGSKPNPANGEAVKKNPISRYFQKRAIKRKYATALKNAKASGKTAKISVGFTQKAFNLVTSIVRRNPIFLIKAALLGLVLFLIISLFTMCSTMISNSTALIGVASYLAEDSAIDNAALAYSEWEIELQLQIANVQNDFPNFDEYRFQVDYFGHNPLELIAYLTVVHHDFTYPEIRAVLRELFDEQYQLTFTPSVEIRHYEDEEGNLIPYEWHVLTTILTMRSLTSIINQRLTADQQQHFGILMLTAGARQIVGSPFDFNWMPFITSHYGWRISPISGLPELHRGIDIGLPTGTPILAAHDGIITFANALGGYGNVVFIVSHCGEFETRYAHCDTILVTVGQEVSMGDVIATVGNTGNSTGSHLHFEILRNGNFLNPIFFSMTNTEVSDIDFGNPGTPMGDGTFEALLTEAMRHMGAPYVWGASGPNAFDCSGFIYYVLNRSGVANVGRTTAQGYFNMSRPVSPSDARPGDLIFFQGTFSSTRTVTHVGFYIGEGRMIHTGSNPNGVEIVSIHTPFWQRHFYNFGRIVN